MTDTSKLKKIVNQMAADKLGLSDLKSRINKSLKYLREHPILNSTVFLLEDQELVKNHLETVEYLINDDNLEPNIESFLSLFNTQIEFIKTDFEYLYEFVKGDGHTRQLKA